MKRKIFFTFITFLYIFFFAALSSAQFFFHINNHLGSTRAILDEQGNLKEYCDYYPFGKTLRSSIVDESITTFKFTGKELDDENGLNWYNFGARPYDADIGRFLTVDPLADSSPSFTPYHYCANNPLIFIDPTGDDWFYYQAQGDSTASYHWHNSSEITTIDQHCNISTLTGFAGGDFAYENGDYIYLGTKEGDKFTAENISWFSLIFGYDVSISTKLIDGQWYAAYNGIEWIGGTPPAIGLSGKLINSKGMTRAWNYFQHINKGRKVTPTIYYTWKGTKGYNIWKFKRAAYLNYPRAAKYIKGAEGGYNKGAVDIIDFIIELLKSAF